MTRPFVAAALFLLTVQASFIPQTQGAPQEQSAPATLKESVLQDATPVRLRLNRTVSSADSHVGDTVDFVVEQDVSVNGILVIRNGTLAFGTVTDAVPTRRMARGGRLEINVDFVELVDGEKAALRAVEGGKGGSHLLAMTTGFVTAGLFFFPAAPPFLLMHGKDMVIPKGAEVTAYLNGDVKLDPARFQHMLPESANAAVASVPLSATLQEPSPLAGWLLNHTYTNESFALSYRLPPDWVFETDLIKKILESEKDSQAANLILAAVHIPQDVTELRADPSLIVLAVRQSASVNTETCNQYLNMQTAALRRSKAAKQKEEITTFTVAGHEFSRLNLEYRSGRNDRAELCSPAYGYLLMWKLDGSTWDAVDEAVSTVYAIAPWTPRERPRQSERSAQHSISQNTAAGLLLKRVQPVYPQEARENHIHGKVRIKALISQTGDVEVVEILNGPPELVPSGVTAVRQWKYRPYLDDGHPVAVSAEIVLNYM